MGSVMSSSRRRTAEQPPLEAVAALSLTSVPQFPLSLIISHLSKHDRESLALVHSIFAEHLRQQKSKAAACVFSPDQLTALCRVLRQLPHLKFVSLTMLTSGTSLHELSAPPSCESLDLAFADELPSRRSLASLAINFSNLKDLALEGPKCHTHRLNHNGSLNVLSSLSSLRNLRLTNISGDKGLERVTQLHTLDVTFPDHGDDDIESPVCPSCGGIHPEDLAVFIAAVDWDDRVVIGPNLRSLPHLKKLTLRFGAIDDEVCLSAILNGFDFRPRAQREGKGGGGGSGSGGRSREAEAARGSRQCFPALEVVVIQGAGSPDSVVFPTHVGLLGEFDYCALDLWDQRRVREAFQLLPSLMHWRMEVGEAPPSGLVDLGTVLYQEELQNGRGQLLMSYFHDGCIAYLDMHREAADAQEEGPS